MSADVREFPANLTARIRRAIAHRLSTAPDLYGDRLAKDPTGLWKLRVGDYRVVFALEMDIRRVTIWAIRNRKNVYSEVLRRWHRR